MAGFLQELAFAFAGALGMVVGGSLATGAAALLTGGLPLDTMADMSRRLKLWAAVAGVGGALVAFRTLESGVTGETRETLRQVVLIGTAFAGAHLGELLVRLAAGK